jgi:hypothetical protein
LTKTRCEDGGIVICYDKAQGTFVLYGTTIGSYESLPRRF